MRRYVAAMLLLILLCSIALAHGGDLDSNGGHYDSFSGEYHYHHGYPAHVHSDGQCPYDFQDNSGLTSGYGSSGSAAAFGASAKESATAYIATQSAVIRARPTEYSTALDTLPKYAHLRSDGTQSGEWIKVSYLYTTGWVHCDALAQPNSSATAQPSAAPAKKEIMPMTFKNVALLVGVGFVAGLVLLLIYRCSIHAREERMKDEAYQRECKSFSDGRKAAESELEDREAELKKRETLLERQRISLRVAERTFRVREAEFFTRAKKLRDELPPKDEILRVKVTDRWGYRTLYHRLDSPCVKHAEIITLQTAHELHLLPCKKCKPDEQELLELPPRSSLPLLELAEKQSGVTS